MYITDRKIKILTIKCFKYCNMRECILQYLCMRYMSKQYYNSLINIEK